MKSDQYKKALNSAYNRVHNQWPRLQIMIILALTGVAAFLISAVLLRLGVTQMVVRYPIAIAAAYGVFIMLIGFWLWLQREDVDMAESAVEVLDFVDDGRIASSGSVNLSGMNTPTISSSGGGGGGSGIDLPGIDIDLDLDDLIWVVLALVVLIAGLLAIFYIVWIAPVLLTEVLVDGLLAAGLYKTVKNVEGRHWMTTVLRKTAIPAILALVFFSIAGFYVQKIEPKASSIGEAWRMLSK
ncbi:MAG TPA: hypothetical protein VK612_06215 [Pyrinomonadaceae bacterium]|nr:hypothetical protein [Pyrinomonadaceae bacterium]